MSFESQRPKRFIGGVALLVISGAILTGISLEALGIVWPLPLATFLCYLLIQAILMSWLVGILFQQHEMRKFKIGIGAMLIITTMIALPMGAASVYRRQAVPEPELVVAEQVPGQSIGSPKKNELAIISTIFALIMYFSLLPLLMVCEAVLAWYLAFRKRRRL